MFLIRNYAKRQKSFENLRFMLTKNHFEKEKSLTFYLNQRFVTKSLRRHNLYVIIRKKTLFDIRSKESFEMNKKQSFRQSRFRICYLFHL